MQRATAVEALVVGESSDCLFNPTLHLLALVAHRVSPFLLAVRTKPCTGSRRPEKPRGLGPCRHRRSSVATAIEANVPGGIATDAPAYCWLRAR